MPRQYQLPIPKVPVQGPTTQQTVPPIPPVNQPNMAAYQRQWVNVYEVAPPVRTEGATRLQTFPVPPVSQPLNYSYDVNRYLNEGPQKQFDGATRQQTYIFPVSQPYIVRVVQQPEVVKRFENTVVAAPQTYVFPVNQPYIVVATQFPLYPYPKQFDGATNQQTYVFPVNQPFIKVATQFPVPSVTPSFTGASTQQTFIFSQTAQPYIVVPTQLPIPSTVPSFSGATNQQTYIFQLSQPELRAFIDKLNQNRYMVDTVKIFDGAGTPVGTGRRLLLILNIGQ